MEPIIHGSGLQSPYAAPCLRLTDGFKVRTKWREESDQRFQLSELVIDHARMIQTCYSDGPPEVIVEISDLSACFRETPKNIKAAPLLRKRVGRAEPGRHQRRRVWIVSTELGGHKTLPQIETHCQTLDRERNLGAA